MSNNNAENLVYLNALNCLSLLGPASIRFLLEQCGSARLVWESPAADLTIPPGLKRDSFAVTITREREAIDPLKEWERLAKMGISVLSQACPDYPSLLQEIPYPPVLLYCRGSLERLNDPSVAVVGSRRSTFYGQEVAGRLAEELSRAGIGVISGMALGVDTAAHRGALSSGGYTVAVLGCGLDRCYPPANRGLMTDIAISGLLLTEFPPGTKPLPAHFPRRNRIISGLSLGTVVVEATAKSGALITAEYALEQNKEVFAVPGNVGSPYSRGCHRLLKEGAHLVEGAADILDELFLPGRDADSEKQDCKSIPLEEGEQKLLQLVPYQPLHMDELIRLSGEKASTVNAILLSLELKQYIRQAPGRYFYRHQQGRVE